jgi:predicted transposase YbfD/YdcC
MRCGDTGHELKLAQELLASPAVDLVGAVVTADALHCQHGTLHRIVAQKGGDYFISLKDNQPQAAKYARDMLADAPFLPSLRKRGMGAS